MTRAAQASFVRQAQAEPGGLDEQAEHRPQVS
jgi:hypothetical protein